MNSLAVFLISSSNTTSSYFFPVDIMSAYPEIFLPISQYLEVATTLQQNDEPTARALSYWARWSWVKKGGELFQKLNSQDQAVGWI